MISDMVPRDQLIDLGFIEIKEGLFLKKIRDVDLYRDYRKAYPLSYAYHKEKRIDANIFKETLVIQKIEQFLSTEDLYDKSDLRYFDTQKCGTGGIPKPGLLK